MFKFIMVIFLFCVLLIQSGCDSVGNCLLSDAFISKIDKSEIEKQKDERRFTQLKFMLDEDY